MRVQCISLCNRCNIISVSPPTTEVNRLLSQERTEVKLIGTPLTHEQNSSLIHHLLQITHFRAQERTEVKLIGTPLTHERFLRRHRGSYGPGISARTGSFPGPKTPVPGLYACGDSTMPGIGVPAGEA